VIKTLSTNSIFLNKAYQTLSTLVATKSAKSRRGTQSFQDNLIHSQEIKASFHTYKNFKADNTDLKVEHEHPTTEHINLLAKHNDLHTEHINLKTGNSPKSTDHREQMHGMVFAEIGDNEQ